MNRGPYAPSYRFQDGAQSAYNAGLSYFPDVPFSAPTPMGDWMTDLAIAGGGAVGGPGGAAAAGAASSVIQRWFGGSAVDQQRQDRVNYFAQLAVNGNVAAMQLILGAPSNVSGNEKQMWETAANLIRQANPDVYREASDAGPYWLVNSGDSATNYPRMRQFAQAWAAQHPVQTVVGTVSGAVSDFFTGGGASPSTPQGTSTLPAVPVKVGMSSSTLLLGAAAVAVLALASRRRR